MSSPAVARSVAASAVTVIEDSTCTNCGCVCDDIDVTVQEGQITHAERACELGKAWFYKKRSDDHPSCRIEGRPASVAEGVERTARLLIDARYPLVHGLSDTTSEAQRVAVAIADAISGTVDTATTLGHGPSGMSFHDVGEVTCTLGEIANRGDLIIFWGANPAESHPRHFSKYSLMPKGMFVPNGREDRTAVGVDVRRTKTADEMDLFFQIKPGSDFEALWTLRALAKDVDVDPRRVEDATGIELTRWRNLMDRMKGAKFGVILFGTGLTMTRGKHLNTEALLSLTRDMNAYTRFVVKPLYREGNTSGADNVVTWQTGHPFGVNLSRGYPRFNPGEYTSLEMLERQETDAALLVGAEAVTSLSERARARLNSIPYVTVDPVDTPTARAATVWFATATYGINTAGTVYRMDDVPIYLRPALPSSHPSDFDVLTAIHDRVTELTRHSEAGSFT